MRRCPLSYTQVEGRYDLSALRRLHPKLRDLEDLQYTSQDLLWEAGRLADKLSIQGVQPKLSARLNLQMQTFELVEIHGHFILKPQHHQFLWLPENEDLTMKLAALSGLEVPDHGLVYGWDEVVTYWIRRFDRFGRNQKRPLEDFAQLLGEARDTKYGSSLEEVAGVIKTYCSFPAVEYAKLFRLIIFSFLCGNEDQHLKNFSLMDDGKVVRLSPCYDLVNSTIALKKTSNELALPLRDKQQKLEKEDFLDYFGLQILGLPPLAIDKIMREMAASLVKWPGWIHRSFLPGIAQERYLTLVRERASRLGFRQIDLEQSNLEILAKSTLQMGSGGHQSFFKQLEMQRSENRYCVTAQQFQMIQDRQTGSGGWQTAYRILADSRAV